MSETETAQQALEHAHHAAEHPDDGHARQAALLIGVLAAALAISEMQEKGAQNAYLAHHISISDTWAFYQAKKIRADAAEQAASILESLPGAATDPAIERRITAARQAAQHLRSDPAKREGVAELQQQAAAEGELRAEALHRYHRFELVNGALQIAIVLGSVSVVTRVRQLLWAAAGLGGLAIAGGALVAAGAL